MFAQTVTTVVIDFVALITSAICGMIVWNWFVPVIFPAAPSLTLAFSIGLILVVSLFKGSSSNLKIEEVLDQSMDTIFINGILNQLVSGVTRPILVLGMAWVVQYFAFSA